MEPGRALVIISQKIPDRIVERNPRIAATALMLYLRFYRFVDTSLLNASFSRECREQVIYCQNLAF